MKKNCAWLDEPNKIRVVFTEVLQHTTIKPVIKDKQQIYAIESMDWNEKEVIIILEQSANSDEEMTLYWIDMELPIYPRGIVRTDIFEEKYDAREALLGVNYSRRKTSFSIWAPTATNMVLSLNQKEYLMQKKPNGVWTVAVRGDYHLARYYFLITVNGEKNKINDPYAKGLTPNGIESVVLDSRRTDPVDFRNETYAPVSKADAIIYELHVRDATSAEESGVTERNRGKFLGLTELNTTNPAGYSTGLSYIRELGCTHVQLLPLQDFARVDELNPSEGYNWGYDPLHYFVPEGSFATDACDPVLRVKECKEMIHAFHKEGLSVILDVVFNHVYDHENSDFEKVLPGYFFRYQPDGKVSDATGTGNDLATERVMVRKFILDCVDYWLSEYLVDGFRFDLMGIIDVETMQAIRERCNQEDRPILLLGEGWELDTPLLPKQKSSTNQSDHLMGISFFNDSFRDVVKGKLFDQLDTGYVNGNGMYNEKMPQLVAGSSDQRFGNSLFSDPLQSVNYVECHDNHTLWDRLDLSNPTTSNENKKQMHQLATGLTLLSQGIPFIHAGQEFFRTKKGDENSYLSGDQINQLDWSQREIEDQNVQWVRQLIQFRKAHRLLRLGNAKEIEHRLHIIRAQNPALGFLLAGADEDLVVFINPTNETIKVEMPALGRWEKSLSNKRETVTEISCLLDSCVTIDAYELAVFKKKRE
ncbi:type I pullulanase [Paraliobacillus sediminis]|uniref:type I pullulanase n=1 Tax=Paraliobacillus sediminis TaxID=1885916 RepID=UPI000E3D73DE|nr:type I pullulanase [Paraliobacillus sediminis]